VWVVTSACNIWIVLSNFSLFIGVQSKENPRVIMQHPKVQPTIPWTDMANWPQKWNITSLRLNWPQKWKAWAKVQPWKTHENLLQSHRWIKIHTSSLEVILLAGCPTPQSKMNNTKELPKLSNFHTKPSINKDNKNTTDYSVEKARYLQGKSVKCSFSIVDSHTNLPLM